jgi:hypothetical protein
MNSFWGNVFEYFNDRRVAAVFFGTLMALGALLIVGLILYQVIFAYELQDYIFYSLPGAVLILSAWVGHCVARARARRLDRYKSSPLSRDELVKARSKLITKPTFEKS